MSESLLNSLIVGVLGMLLSFLSAWFWFQRQQAVKDADALKLERTALLKRVDDLERKEMLASAAFIPIASAFQATLIKSLTHAHAGELDALLVKVGDHSLLPEEEPRLLRLLDERTRDMDPRITERDRKIAGIFPVVAEIARDERLLLVRAADAQLRVAAVVAAQNPDP